MDTGFNPAEINRIQSHTGIYRLNIKIYTYLFNYLKKLAKSFLVIISFHIYSNIYLVRQTVSNAPEDNKFP